MVNKLLHYVILVCIVFAFVYFMSQQEERFETIEVPIQLQSQENSVPKPDTQEPQPQQDSKREMNNIQQQPDIPAPNVNTLIDVTTNIENRDKKLKEIGTNIADSFQKGIKVNSASVDDIKNYDKYVNDFVFAGKTFEDGQQVSDVQIKQEQEKFIKFRDTVWNPATYLDPVDKMNEIAYQSGGDFDKVFEGKKMSDIYTDITTPDMFAEQKLVKPLYDNQTKQPYYIENGFGGSYIIDDTWVYDKEIVSNGGNFYDDIYPTIARKSDKNVVYK